ncbi:MAG: hypothetical protein ACREIA_04290 [Opitutaceae bacterium]
MKGPEVHRILDVDFGPQHASITEIAIVLFVVEIEQGSGCYS